MRLEDVLLCQAELRKEGWGSIWSDYWLFSSPPSLTLSVFLLVTHLLFFLWFHSVLVFHTCQGNEWKVSLDKLWMSHTLSSTGKLKCLSQLLGIRGFREALGRCSVLLLALLSFQLYLLLLDKLTKVPWCCVDWYVLAHGPVSLLPKTLFPPKIRIIFSSTDVFYHIKQQRKDSLLNILVILWVWGRVILKVDVFIAILQRAKFHI